MANELREFMSGVLAITPRYGDIMVNGIPGEGMPNMDADVVNELRRTVTEFAEAYGKLSADQDELRQLAANVEAALMATVTVGVATDHVIDPLIEKLHDLVAAKSSQPAN